MLNEAREHELLTRLEQQLKEIQFIKQQQWQILYYTILSFSGLIGLSKIDKLQGNCFFLWFCYLAVGFLAILTIVYQFNFFRSLNSYRVNADIIEGLLSMKLQKQINDEYEKRCKNKEFARGLFAPPPKRDYIIRTKISLMYLIPFIVMIAGLAIVAIIIISS